MTPEPYQSHHCYCSRVRLFLLLLRICFYAALCAALFLLIPQTDIGTMFSIAGGIILFLLFLRRSLYRKYACFCFSDTELIVSCGILVRSTDHVPFSEIESVYLQQSAVDRLIGVAHVHICPKKKDADEARASYACIHRGAYVCVLPKRFAEGLHQKVQEKIL